MNYKVLLKEIPGELFRSAVFTTYTFNFYYFEQQILPLLHSKGVNYISVLVDAVMLETELNLYSSYSQSRKRSYSLNGIQNKGAFHPKIIFLAGPESLLVLIGSGNLTSSGHGKNLEGWNAILVTDVADVNLGFIIQCWNYIKKINAVLGELAMAKLTTIEENCSLLKNTNNKLQDFYFITNKLELSFLASGESSLISQLNERIGGEKINIITIMCPYYDLSGKFIEYLDTKFKPLRINLILQNQCGISPLKMKLFDHIHIYDWSKIKSNRIKQTFSHAKKIVFQGKKYSYLLSGSANASIAAFGMENLPGRNEEACVLYRSTSFNFEELLDIDINRKSSNLKDFENTEVENTEPEAQGSKPVFLRSLEKGIKNILVYYSSSNDITGAELNLINTQGRIVLQSIYDLKARFDKLEIASDFSPDILYGYFSKNDAPISNKQFANDKAAFDRNNPSPKNLALNYLKNVIETGKFSPYKIVGYLSIIDKKIHQTHVSSAVNPDIDEKYVESKLKDRHPELIHVTYEEIAKELENLPHKHRSHIYREYKTVRLWESIMIYLKGLKSKEFERMADEEETEDVNKSVGKEVLEAKKVNGRTLSGFDQLRKKMIKFFDDYLDILDVKVNAKTIKKPTVIDISMYLIVLEILFHVAAQKEQVKNEDNDYLKLLLDINFSEEDCSVSEYLLNISSRFLLWSNKAKDDNDTENKPDNTYITLREVAFKATVSALTLFDLLNNFKPGMKEYRWYEIGLLNAEKTLNEENKKWKLSEFMELIPTILLAEISEKTFETQFKLSLSLISNLKVSGRPIENEIYKHKTDGFCSVLKVISNENTNRRFLKLINPGYNWSNDMKNYCNEALYSQFEETWMRTKVKSPLIN